MYPHGLYKYSRNLESTEGWLIGIRFDPENRILEEDTLEDELYLYSQNDSLKNYMTHNDIRVSISYIKAVNCKEVAIHDISRKGFSDLEYSTIRLQTYVPAGENSDLCSFRVFLHDRYLGNRRPDEGISMHSPNVEGT